MSLTQYQAALNRPTRVRPGETWFAKLPGSHTVACVVIDEVTRKTVAVRQEADLSAKGNTAEAIRYARDDVKFVEKVRA